MRPRIEASTFGSITIEGREIGNDVILKLDGSVQKRKEKAVQKGLWYLPYDFTG